MQAYREIIEGMRLRQVVNLPEKLKKSWVEIIVLPINKSERGKKTGKLSQNWAGALRDYKEQFTSVELQKKSLEWRSI